MDSAFLQNIVTNQGNNILDMSKEQPIMVVFLRHFGCVFCREALSELAEMQDFVNYENITLVFVHMTDHKTAEKYFQKYGLKKVQGISDPDIKIYKEFGLLKGSFNQVFGLKTWIRTVDAGIIKGIGITTKQIGDGFQMPGIFVISNGVIKSKFIHAVVSDRPNYKVLISEAKSIPD